MSSFWVAAIVVVAASQISILFASIYLHRAMAHRGISLKPLVALFMRTWLWAFTGQVMRTWVAVHRKHHAFTDKEGDPHSPHLKGLWRVFLFNSLYYDRETKNADTIEKYAKDTPATIWDPLLDRSLPGLVVGIVIFSAVFVILLNGWLGIVWGVIALFAHIILYQGMGAVINSFGHMVGYKNFDNTATNFPPAGWLIAGEGWHNNHHHNPASPKMSYKWWEFDPSWLIIKTLIALRLAKQARPTINQVERFSGRQSAHTPPLR